MNRMTGEQSICFEKPPYIRCSASVVGKKEGEGPLGNLFDLICEDPMLGEENWEKAESMLQVKAAKLVLEKAGQMPQRVRYIFAGDLLGQLIATSFGVQELEIPLFGLYGACSTCGETLSLAAMTVNAAMQTRCWQSPPVISEVRKNSSVFLWNMETRDRSLRPGP